MSSVFRLENAEPIQASADWTLSRQIDEVTDWLDNVENARRVRGSVLDIGFDWRLDGSKVMVQGETVPLGFMQKLVSLDITLWLSIYPGPKPKA